MKRRLIIVLSLALAVVTLSVAYAVAQPYFGTEESGSVSGPTHDEDGDLLGTGQRPFMYPNITRADVKDITVTNEHGTYKAYRSGSSFYFEGAENLTYDKEMFSSLVVNATYTLATRKIKLDEYNYEDFGLTDDTLLATVVVNTLDGDTHTLKIGNKLANGGGYYAMYEGKPYIYVLDTTLEDSVLCSLNDYLTPYLVFPIQVTEYVNLTQLYYLRGGEPFFAVRNASESEQEASGSPYVVLYPNDKKYVASSYHYGTVLQTLTQLMGTSVIEYGIFPPAEPELEERGDDETDEEYNERVEEYEQAYKKYEEDNEAYEAILAKYNIGIEGKGHTLLYTYKEEILDDDGKGTGEYAETDFYIDLSEKTENDTYYAYSMLFGIISEVPASTLYWLEWDVSRFLEYQMFSMNINNVNSIKMTFGGKDYEFTIERDTDGKAYKAFAGGKEYNMDAFRQFYVTLLEMRIGGQTTMPVWDVPVMTITIDTTEGKYEYVLYMKTTRKVYYTLNGEGEFYIGVDKMLQLQREAVAIYNGELVE